MDAFPLSLHKEEGIAQGKKGLVIHNVRDEPSFTKTLPPSTVYVTFPSGQETMKSKFASKFDPFSKDISRALPFAIGSGAGAAALAGVNEAKAGEGPPPRQAEMRSYSPTFSERVGNTMQDALMGVGMPSYPAGHIAHGAF